MDVKFPQVKVQLAGQDGNAFSIIGRTQQAMRRAGISAEEIAAYREAATSGDYDNVIAVTMQTVTAT